jgi:hypothetical protein
MISMKGRPQTGVSSARAYKSGPSQGVSSAPGMGALRNPTLSNSQISLQTNTTTSLPLIVRPWSEGFEKRFLVGSLLFTFQGECTNRMSTAADIPTLNYLCAEANTQIPANVEKVSDPKYAKLDGSLGGFKWNFFGVVRNDMMADSSLQKLFNCDVWGRSMIANIFGKVKRGDLIGLALVNKNVAATGLHMNPLGMARPTAVVGDHALQIVGTLNGKVVDLSIKPPHVLLLIPLGIVSHAVSRVPSPGLINKALRCQDDYTQLPQIEVLLC